MKRFLKYLYLSVTNRIIFFDISSCIMSLHLTPACCIHRAWIPATDKNNSKRLIRVNRTGKPLLHAAILQGRCQAGAGTRGAVNPPEIRQSDYKALINVISVSHSAQNN